LKQEEQCLRLAALADTPDLAAEYRQMAQEYHELAKAERRMAARLGLAMPVTKPTSEKPV
jgi:hypothetical protein